MGDCLDGGVGGSMCDIEGWQCGIGVYLADGQPSALGTGRHPAAKHI